jgi:protein TonB
VRVDAEFDPRFADDFLPPYPPARERAEQEGRVRVRLTIGADGRVKSVVRLSATHEDFWNATERHVRNRWRFRPATLDGRPVETSKTMTIDFRLEDA